MTEVIQHKIIHDPEPVRLFSSDVLEFFTHVHPAVVPIVWVPVAAYCLITAVHQAAASAASPLYILLCFVLGLVLWSLTEYMVHRFVFHLRPRSSWQEKVVFLFHGIHHLQPQCKTRLVMPPAVSVPMAVIFYVLFYVVWNGLLGLGHWVFPLFAGFIAGYICYDMIHYATHHLPMRHGWWKFLKRYHMQHHYKTPEQRFGVSSPLWDKVFGTWPV